MRAPALKPGAKFDKLTVESKHSLNSWGKNIWLCRCECGNEVLKTQNDLAKMKKAGRHIHCGCGPVNNSWETRRKEIIDMQGKVPVVTYKEQIQAANINSWVCYG